MPEAINRAFTQMFPSRRREIQNPLRRRAVSTYDAARTAINSPTGQAVQSFLFGQSPVEAPTDPRIAKFGQIVGQTSRGRLADIVNRALPTPVHKAMQFVGDPYEAIEGPLGGSTQAIMGAHKRAKELGLITQRAAGSRTGDYRKIMVHDPQLQTRYIGRKKLGREIDRMGGYDAHGQYGGTIGAYIDYHKRGNITPSGEDMFRLETGLNLKEKPPSYYVGYAKTLERPNPEAPRDPFAKGITIEPAYTSQAFEELLKVGAEENPGKIYTIEASLINEDLMRLAENFGILGFKHGYGSEAVYFAKDGRLIPLPKAMEELGEAGPNLSGRTASQRAAEYRQNKKLEKARQRDQSLEFRELQRRMEASGQPMPEDPNMVPASAIDWMGEGQPPVRTPRDYRGADEAPWSEGPIGFDDSPPDWGNTFPEDDIRDNPAFDRAIENTTGYYLTEGYNNAVDAAYTIAAELHFREGMDPDQIRQILVKEGYNNNVILTALIDLQDSVEMQEAEFLRGVVPRGERNR